MKCLKQHLITTRFGFALLIFFFCFCGFGGRTTAGGWTSALRGPEWNGDFPQQAKNAFCVYKCTACQVAKLGMKERIRQWKM